MKTKRFPHFLSLLKMIDDLLTLFGYLKDRSELPSQCQIPKDKDTITQRMQLSIS